MKVALIGSHGTGKTTVFDGIKSRHPDYQYFHECVRHQVPSFGYETPYQIVDQFGIGAFELMNINSWSVIDPLSNPGLDLTKPVITDRSSVDAYAYFLSLKKDKDLVLAELVKKMSRHYASLIDTFVYFPTGVFPLQGDAMRPDDVSFQKEVDKNIHVALSELAISEERCYHLKSKGINDRIEEVLQLINK